ncbi:hypothetical protein SLEP1_g12418 [Rubroshorea leprosula]|uniref:Uncharacterized protein n=1 Tax=Rubroshorea leprosula TaxID=152421 RepID=A0AAV5IL32_9ROSI|nr:hypothetical protein SLEP1_g12418 [Rubroshorea leprosula]
MLENELMMLILKIIFYRFPLEHKFTFFHSADCYREDYFPVYSVGK